MRNTFLLFLFALSFGYAQTSATLADAGYSAPSPPQVAPGQVLTLYFRGVRLSPDGKLRSERADHDPLPGRLAGLAVRLSQNEKVQPVPILSVRQERECGELPAVPAVCVLTAIKVQIPYELAVSPTFEATAELILDEDGQTSRAFLVQPLPDNTHVLTSCDITTETRSATLCNRVAYHADGRVVDQYAPAQNGETILVYAFGLGQTVPTAETGKPSPPGARIPESGRPRVWATFRDSPVNAYGATPRRIDQELMNPTVSGIDFSGLTPGEIGLYQLNVPIPSSLKALTACGAEVSSNAVLLITTYQGTEPIPFCLAFSDPSSASVP